MPKKKPLKFILAFFVLILSVTSILLSDTSSKQVSFGTNGVKTAPTQKPGESVEGASASVIDQNQKNNPVEQIDAGSDSQPSESEGAQIYKVVHVVDGDTLDVDIDGRKTRIRVIGIDTPETVDPRKTVQCFGVEASNKAKQTLSNQFVTIESDPTQDDKDRYGRLLRYITLSDGTDYGFFMISNGYAHEYTYHISYEKQSDYRQAESDARDNNRGLWSPDTCSGNK
jgi:micrococcal nuclease